MYRKLRFCRSVRSSLSSWKLSGCPSPMLAFSACSLLVPTAGMAGAESASAASRLRFSRTRMYRRSREQTAGASATTWISLSALTCSIAPALSRECRMEQLRGRGGQ